MEYKICDYCHIRVAKYVLKNGKVCCEKYWQQCPKKRSERQIIMKAVMNQYESKERISKLRSGKKDSEITKEKKRLSLIGNSRKKGKKESKKTRLLKSISHTYNLSDYKIKHPLLLQIEELREYSKTKELQGRCKNHKCKNSKEKNGWFTLKSRQIENRLRAIYYANDGSYFYCSKKCKDECILYNYQESNITKNKCYTKLEYKMFRKFVLERDNYICQYCGNEATIVHHEKPQKLDPFFALDPDYAWSCCKKCHYSKGHKKGTNCSTGNLANHK